MLGFGYNRILPKLGGVKITPTEIFGANLYDWWDYTDLATQSISGGGQINSITSKGTNAGVFASSGTARPDSIVGVNGLNVADFDGVNDFMQVAGSTGMYNFLHNGSLGTVIMINRIEDLNPNNSQSFLDNTDSSSLKTGYVIRYDDRSSFSRNNVVINAVTKSISTDLTILNISSNNTYNTQQYNLLINKIDADASPVADRSAISVNGGAEIKNNTNIFSPSLLNASYNFTLGKLSTSAGFYLKGQIPEIIILTSHPTPTQITQLNNYYLNKYGAPFPIV